MARQSVRNLTRYDKMVCGVSLLVLVALTAALLN
jgi:hypothetical protein